MHSLVQVMFWVGNQGNHQNFDPSLLPKKRRMIIMEMKKKKLKKKIQNGRLKKKFFKTANFQYDYPGFQPKTAPAQSYATQFMLL